MSAGHNLAIDLARNGDTAQAVDLLTQILERRTRVLGADHPETVRTRDQLTKYGG